jgi:hypothetical protein
VEPRRRKPTALATRRLRARPTGARTVPLASLRNEGRFLPAIEELLAREGQISIGAISPIPCAAIANDEHNMLAALMRRPEETLQQLLERLDQR